MTKTVNPTTKEVRKFGLMFAVICIAAAGFVLFQGEASWPWFAFAAVVFLISGLVGYQVLRPLYIGWMKFAFVLGWINTRLLLSFFFYVILTPVGVVMRLFGKDLLDKKLEPGVNSYWKKRTGGWDPHSMERQF